ncbi:hypothetical protein ACH5RR_008404 [Cinchona calisaya]|uniref:Uncharacterized protein n=1 Tax=Cinchona calisaya TaxID=153742 RepID=A0ABD3AF29_9GENT
MHWTNYIVGAEDILPFRFGMHLLKWIPEFLVDAETSMDPEWINLGSGFVRDHNRQLPASNLHSIRSSWDDLTSSLLNIFLDGIKQNDVFKMDVQDDKQSKHKKISFFSPNHNHKARYTSLHQALCSHLAYQLLSSAIAEAAKKTIFDVKVKKFETVTEINVIKRFGDGKFAGVDDGLTQNVELGTKMTPGETKALTEFRVGLGSE